jgi:predicted HAD superfamily Cof-like phosphohydrolase
LEDHWDLFRRHVQRPPERLLEMIGEIKVARLQEIGRSHATPIELTVEPKPEDWNQAHAEIPQKITKGLANKILPALILHRSPQR